MSCIFVKTMEQRSCIEGDIASIEAPRSPDLISIANLFWLIATEPCEKRWELLRICLCGVAIRASSKHAFCYFFLQFVDCTAKEGLDDLEPILKLKMNASSHMKGVGTLARKK